MSSDSSEDIADDFQTELTEVMLEPTKLATRFHMMEAQDDPKLAALLARANVILERLTSAEALLEPIRIQ